MLIHDAGKNISTKRATCHSTRTGIFEIRWNGPTGGCNPREDISHKYILASLIPDPTLRQGLSRCAFQGLFFAGSAFVEMSSRRLRRVASQAEWEHCQRIWYLSRKPQPLQAQSQRTAAPESRFDRLYFGGFPGGLVEVALW